jgi:hypothetical protein
MRFILNIKMLNETYPEIWMKIQGYSSYEVSNYEN